jgi:hypothetical protein
MNIREFFFTSVLFAVLAIGLHLTGMSQVSRGVGIRAQAVTFLESERAAAKVEASRISRRGVVLGYVSVPFALASVGFAVASVRRREPARRSIVLGLLICYVMFQFVLV